MKTDCKWWDDVECPYATGYQSCDDCSSYEPYIHAISCKCPDCEADRGEYLRDQQRDRRMMDEDS